MAQSRNHAMAQAFCRRSNQNGGQSQVHSSLPEATGKEFTTDRVQHADSMQTFLCEVGEDHFLRHAETDPSQEHQIGEAP